METSRRKLINGSGIYGVVSSAEEETNTNTFILQNIAEKIALGDNPEYKNGILASFFWGIVAGFIVSYFLLYVIIKNQEYYFLTLPLFTFVVIVYFFTMKGDIADGKKDLVVKSIFDDLNYLKNSFSSKFDLKPNFMLFVSGNFVIKFSDEGGFRVVYFEKNESLQDINMDDVLQLTIKYFLEIDKLIANFNVGTSLNKDSTLLIVNRNYFVENLLKQRKKLRKAINSLLKSSKVFYLEDMKTYCCISEWKNRDPGARF